MNNGVRRPFALIAGVVAAGAARPAVFQRPRRGDLLLRKHTGNLGRAIPGKAKLVYLLDNRRGFLVNDIVLVLVHEVAIHRLAGNGLAAHAFCSFYCLDFLARISHQPFVEQISQRGIVESGDEWERQFEGREVPEEYRIMSYPQQERGEQDKVFMDAAETQQAAVQTTEPQQSRPVVPIILTSDKPAEKVKEITARLEQGVQAIFDSDRYKEFLTAMSKFHDYSLNNTILIAMQGGNLVKGYSQWQKEFDRHVKSGEKGIKIFAPAPYKVKKLVDKIDPDTRKPILDSEGKTVKEEKEVTVPAFKVVTVFDIS